MKKHFLLASICCLAIFGLNGCIDASATTSKMAESSELKVSTNMADSIFIEPVAKSKKTVFIFAKNTTSCNLNLESKLSDGVISKGYNIVDDPENATFILGVNVLECASKTQQELKTEALSTVNPGLAYLASQNKSTSDSFVDAIRGEDTTWQLKVDVNIKQRVAGKVINQSGANTSKQHTKTNSYTTGSSNSNSLSQNYESNFIEKATVVYSRASKRGLTMVEAAPIIEEEVAARIYNLF